MLKIIVFLENLRIDVINKQKETSKKIIIKGLTFTPNQGKMEIINMLSEHKLIHPEHVSMIQEISRRNYNEAIIIVKESWIADYIYNRRPNNINNVIKIRRDYNPSSEHKWQQKNWM